MNDFDAEYQHCGANVFKCDNIFPWGSLGNNPDGELACRMHDSRYMITVQSKARQIHGFEQTSLRIFFAFKKRNSGTLHRILINFNQAAFAASASNWTNSNGYLFVPRSCAAVAHGLI